VGRETAKDYIPSVTAREVAGLVSHPSRKNKNAVRVGHPANGVVVSHPFAKSAEWMGHQVFSSSFFRFKAGSFFNPSWELFQIQARSLTSDLSGIM